MALQASPSRAQEAGLPGEPRLALAAAGVLAGALWGAKSLAQVPYVGAVALTLVVFAQLWWPVSRCDHHGRSTSAIGLTWGRGRGRQIARDLAEAAAILAVVLPLYAWATAARVEGSARLAALAQQLGLGAWATSELGLHGWRLAAPPPPWAWSQAQVAAAAEACLNQVIGVALPEEAFFRGYLLAQLRRRWPPKGGLLRQATGTAALVSAFLFAIGHWLGEWDLSRLLTFFPALMFGAVASRQGSLTGAVALHAACNLFAQGLAACLQPAS